MPRYAYQVSLIHQCRPRLCWGPLTVNMAIPVYRPAIWPLQPPRQASLRPRRVLYGVLLVTLDGLLLEVGLLHVIAAMP